MEERTIRYNEKIDFIVISITTLPEKPEGDIEISAAFYKLHTSIEGAMDLAAMILKDLGRKVEDDYTNIENLRELGIIDSRLAEKLKKCNGLRNYLVHRYNKVDVELAIGAMEDVRAALYSFIEVVEKIRDEVRRN
jgi:uncharacterized protein YutE (UPF0331/DUF86 family)